MWHYLIMASLFVLAGGHLWWIHRHVVDKVLAGHEDAKNWRAALLGAAWMMILVLLCNAQAFAKLNLIDWEFGRSTPPAWWRLLASHLGVLAATGSLMGLVACALREDVVLREPTPALGAYRAMVVVTEKLLPRFWWAAAGFGVLFGCTAGPGPILVLAADLTLFWLAGRIGLFVQRRQFQRRA